MVVILFIFGKYDVLRNGKLHQINAQTCTTSLSLSYNREVTVVEDIRE